MEKKVIVDNLETESRNPNTMNIDKLSTFEIVKLINQEDQAVITAVRNELEPISKAVDVVVHAIRNGGRLIYMGAGSSGRIGVLDASEWLPTYGVGDESVLGIIAGGDLALRNPIEDAEDSRDSGKNDLIKLGLTNKDVVCALASSGRTPYCIGGLEFAREIGCKTISISNVGNSVLGKYSDIPIEAVTGPEVVTGSTRMKAGTAQKMILNIISTASMILCGKVYGNLMVDMKPTNQKLIHRAWSIIQQATDVSIERSKELLNEAHNSVKHAIIMEVLKVDYEQADQLLLAHKGRVGDVIEG